jgi:sugar lactone lactonase YvrE
MRKLIDGGHFFEGARWHEGAWWVSDMYSHHVLRITPDGRSTVMATVEQEPSGLGWLPDGDLLVVSMQDRKLLRRRPDGSLTVHADLSPFTPWPINDMVVDRHGRAYVGGFGFDTWNGAVPGPATLLRVDPDGTVTAEAEAGDLWFPNGMVITADGKTLVVAESGAARLTAFAIGADGGLSGRRIWAQLGESPKLATAADMVDLAFGPDGCAIDAEDCVWVADALGNRACRVADGGRIVEQVTSDLGIYSCALGGEDGRTLLLCAAPDFHKGNRTAKREAALLLETVGVGIRA